LTAVSPFRVIYIAILSPDTASKLNVVIRQPSGAQLVTDDFGCVYIIIHIGSPYPLHRVVVVDGDTVTQYT